MTNIAHSKVTHLYDSSEAGGKREAILKAALQLFTERGFHGTAMPLVAELAGVGAGTIYRYFESKEALVNTLYRDWKEFQLATILRDMPPEAPLREQFHIYWNRLADFAKEYPTAFGFLELHFHAPYLDEKSRAIEERGHNAMVGYFQECLRQQVVRDAPAEVLGSLVMGAYIGLVKASRNGCLELTRDVLDQAEECCWAAIRR
ncbi:MAG TPA: TetR/AcrR family transcriptional regulator [Blastocatellia bacterium]|nr:TetR/AcrR family transcriptional regulator [Blastocatellia bacterium]